MKPYRQGEIDFFCAVYAIINSVRFACADFYRFSFDDSCAFYQHLMMHLYHTDQFVSVLHSGTNYDLMYELIEVADRYLQKQFRIRLLYAVPFKYRDLSLSRAFLFVKQYLSHSGSSCIVRIDNRITLDHWTVIKKTENKFFALFDSYGYAGMDFKHSIWNDGRDVADKNATLISKQGIILIKCVQI